MPRDSVSPTSYFSSIQQKTGERPKASTTIDISRDVGFAPQACSDPQVCTVPAMVCLGSRFHTHAPEVSTCVPPLLCLVRGSDPLANGSGAISGSITASSESFGPEYQPSVLGHQPSVPGYQPSVLGHRVWVTGHQSLVSALWPLIFRAHCSQTCFGASGFVAETQNRVNN